MSITAQSIQQVQATGDGFPGGPLQTATSVQVSNAPPPQSYQTVNGNATWVMPPATYGFSLLQLKPPTGSAIAKSFCTSGFVVALSGWTAGPITIPVVPGGSVYVQANGVETVEGVFA